MTALMLAWLCATPVEIDALRADLLKVDRRIEETETLIDRTPAAPYVPEVNFRLAELYVEKSRLLFHLRSAEQGGEGRPLPVPEVRLIKEKAVGMYSRLLREAPRFVGNDKVRFYLAHEQRELGQFDEMLKTLAELSKKSPKSPLAAEGEQIVGDYWFDKSDLAEAEKHYRLVLKSPDAPVHDLARYKLGWCRVNQSKHDEAVAFFEAVVRSRYRDSKKSLDLKREALLDLVYNYVEARAPKGNAKPLEPDQLVKLARIALAYFERLSDSVATYALALDKLTTRYRVRQQNEASVTVMRKLLSLRPDPELDLERVVTLYDTLKDTKLAPLADDVAFLIRAAVELRRKIGVEEAERRKQLSELEEMARDWATKIHLAAQRRDDRRLYDEASRAYAAYLGLFRPKAHVGELMKNRADSLYAARDYRQAARQFEELARQSDGVDAAAHQEALYGALLAYQNWLRDDRDAPMQNRFRVADARQALKHLGGQFIRRYPQHGAVAEVRFNIARAYFDDGEYRPAADAFSAFAMEYPEHKDATVAGHLALDALYKARDFKQLTEVGNKLLASRLPDSFKNDARKVLADVEAESLTELALKSAEKEGDVVSGLEKASDEAKDEGTALKALHAALLAAREIGDYSKERALSDKLIQRFPSSRQAKALPLELAHRAADTARFTEAAALFESAVANLEGAKAVEALRAAGNLYLALGETDRGAALLQQAAAQLPAGQKAELLASVAEAYLAVNDAKKARSAARFAFMADSSNARAASVLADSGRDDEVVATLASANGDAAAKGLWQLAEADFDAYAKLSLDELDQKIAAWQNLEPLYMKVIAKGSSEWAVASLWRVGLGYAELAHTIESAGANAQGEEGEALREQIAQKVEPLRSRSEQAFNLCLARADELGVFTPAVLGCRNQSEHVEAPALARAAPTAEGKLPAGLFAKVDRNLNAASLFEVGVAWLERGNPSLAKLALARALEIDRSHAPSHGALGLSLAQLGESTQAAAEYREALSTDPGNAVARANLAALKCRFGDSAGARAEIEQIKDKSSLKAPLVDPGWKTCTEISRR